LSLTRLAALTVSMLLWGSAFTRKVGLFRIISSDLAPHRTIKLK
jgi:hypothetical protein